MLLNFKMLLMFRALLYSLTFAGLWKSVHPSLFHRYSFFFLSLPSFHHFLLTCYGCNVIGFGIVLFDTHPEDWGSMVSRISNFWLVIVLEKRNLKKKKRSRQIKCFKVKYFVFVMEKVWYIFRVDCFLILKDFL